MSLRSLVSRRPVAAFVVLAYALSWTCWLTAQSLYPSTLPPARRTPGQVLTILGTFGPFVAGVLVARFAGEWRAFRARLFRVRVHPVWYIVALSLPVLSVAVGYGVYRLLGGAPMRPGSTLSASMVAGTFLLTLLAGGGNEEPGWRGLALPHLQGRFGPLAGSLILAAVWAGWHLPAFLDPTSSQSMLPPLAWLGGTVAVTFVLTWLFNATGGSVPLAALFHATFNVAGLAVIVALPPNAVAAFYWTGVGVFLAVTAVLLLATRGTLGADAERSAADSRRTRGHSAADGDGREG